MKPLADLTFYNVDYGRMETPWSLNSVLYHGLSSLPINVATEIILEGGLKPPSEQRLALAVTLFENMQGSLTSGRSPTTVKGSYQVLRSFYAWADDSYRDMTTHTIEKNFLDWTDWMFDKCRGNRSAQENAFSRATRIGSVIDAVLDRDRRIMSFSRLRKMRVKKSWGKSSDKVDIEGLFKMGAALTDLCESLSEETIYGSLPAILNFRTGETIEHWSKLISEDKLKGNWHKFGASLKKREAWIADKSWRTRFPLMNLRIEAEILIFVAQTQANLSQVLPMLNGKFSYQSHSGGYHCKRIYKDRREGEVEFNIYSEYRTHFEAYLKWRNAIYPEDGLLFPLKSHFQRTVTNSPNFNATRKILEKLQVPYITPRNLRLAKINWLLRKTRDPEITAEMGQHEEATLLRTYEQPHHQAAASELSRFHQRHDPAFAPPGPGVCIEPTPSNVLDAAKGTPKADCVNPAGCLHCQHQRDIADLDHVWSLVTYRYLKSLELAAHRPTRSAREKHPAQLTMDVLTGKLDKFKGTPEFVSWVDESLIRIEEGNYHPKWDGFVKLMEIRK